MNKLMTINAGGQNCFICANKRDNNSIYVYFTSSNGYGFPTFELDELLEILNNEILPWKNKNE